MKAIYTGPTCGHLQTNTVCDITVNHESSEVKVSGNGFHYRLRYLNNERLRSNWRLIHKKEVSSSECDKETKAEA